MVCRSGSVTTNVSPVLELIIPSVWTSFDDWAAWPAPRVDTKTGTHNTNKLDTIAFRFFFMVPLSPDNLPPGVMSSPPSHSRLAARAGVRATRWDNAQTFGSAISPLIYDRSMSERAVAWLFLPDSSLKVD